MCVIGTSSACRAPPPSCSTHDRLGVAEQLAHRVAAGHVPQGAVLKLARGADDRALAEALDRFGIAAERCEQPARHVRAPTAERVPSSA